ncbi:integrase core domain-containing protein [Streptomyces sp. NBC_01727]|uniref:integrase core domain-containing protein n=1 Tax=Streptomyces sp. NBC_01727 TaxID=2975924 RepID=UPI002E15638D|nr:integrase core domain-containing protein [Streptomyces sp. NBC_01727]
MPPPVRNRGDALDNALMESQIGLYITELINPRRPWHELADVELATAEWVGWFNNQRLHTAIGAIPPHENEVTTTLNTGANRRPQSTHKASTDLGALHSASSAPMR